MLRLFLNFSVWCLVLRSLCFASSVLRVSRFAFEIEGYEAGELYAARDVELSRWRRGETEFFIDNLLVRIHLIIEMILVDRPCAMAV